MEGYYETVIGEAGREGEDGIQRARIEFSVGIMQTR
jgi:hypothetical protein